jgi:undecaprenyl-diphosphatase
MSDTTMLAPPHRDLSAATGEPRRFRSHLTRSVVLLGIFVVYSWLVVTWTPFVHWDTLLNRNFHVHHWWPVLHVLDRVGQRVLCLRPLAIIALVAAWWYRSWRPILLTAFGVFMINLFALIAKLALSRGAPLSGESFFGDGDLYPSGHTSNIVLVYGLCVYLLTRYWAVPRWLRRAMLGLVCLFGLIQFTTSILLRWHWFSDLVGGCLLGGVVLALTAAVDAAVPSRWPRWHWVRHRARGTVDQPVSAAGGPDGPPADPGPRSDDRELVDVSPRRRPGGWPAPAGDRRSHR